MQITRKPAWLRAKLPSGPGFTAVRRRQDYSLIQEAA